jgi:hypothetical protein
MFAGSQTGQQVFLSACPPEGENAAWSFETSGIYTMETVNDAANGEPVESKAGVAQATHMLTTPQRPRRAIPTNVRRALLVFCVVGVLAFVTDGVLLALSLSRHHTVSTQRRNVPVIGGAQDGISPTSGITPTSGVQVAAAVPFALSPQRLVFSAVQGQSNLTPQIITLSASSQGFSWQISSQNQLPAWLRFSTEQGNVPPGGSGSFAVNARPAGLVPRAYSANVQVKAFDAQGNMLAGSPATFAIVLNVRQPCALTITPAKLSFAAVLLSAPSPQTLTLSESAGCTFPVSWQVSADASWVTFSRSSGTDSASGATVTVQAVSSDKLIGSSTAHITFQGTDGVGAPLVITPATITATLTVLA